MQRQVLKSALRGLRQSNMSLVGGSLLDSNAIKYACIAKRYARKLVIPKRSAPKTENNDIKDVVASDIQERLPLWTNLALWEQKNTDERKSLVVNMVNVLPTITPDEFLFMQKKFNEKKIENRTLEKLLDRDQRAMYTSHLSICYLKYIEEFLDNTVVVDNILRFIQSNTMIPRTDLQNWLKQISLKSAANSMKSFNFLRILKTLSMQYPGLNSETTSNEDETQLLSKIIDLQFAICVRSVSEIANSSEISSLEVFLELMNCAETLKLCWNHSAEIFFEIENPLSMLVSLYKNDLIQEIPTPQQALKLLNMLSMYNIAVGSEEEAKRVEKLKNKNGDENSDSSSDSDSDSESSSDSDSDEESETGVKSSDKTENDDKEQTKVDNTIKNTKNKKINKDFLHETDTNQAVAAINYIVWKPDELNLLGKFYKLGISTEVPISDMAIILALHGNMRLPYVKDSNIMIMNRLNATIKTAIEDAKNVNQTNPSKISANDSHEFKLLISALLSFVRRHAVLNSVNYSSERDSEIITSNKLSKSYHLLVKDSFVGIRGKDEKELPVNLDKNLREIVALYQRNLDVATQHKCKKLRLLPQVKPKSGKWNRGNQQDSSEKY